MMSRIFSHLGNSLRNHGALFVATLLVLTGGFTVSGACLLASQNLNQVLTLWGESVQMSVYLKEDATPEQSALLKRKMVSDHRVGQVQFVSRENAIQSLQKQMATVMPELVKDVELLKLIPQSFQVQVSKAINPADQFETLKNLSSEWSQDASVSEVSYGQDWVKTYAAVVDLLSRGSTWLVLLLCTSSFFVISNSISSSIQQRRGEIEVLELVGASKSFIRAPFLFEGIALGITAAAMALVVLSVGFHFLQGAFGSQLSFMRLAHEIHFFPWWGQLSFIVTGIFIGYSSARLSLGRLNDGWSAASRSRRSAR